MTIRYTISCGHCGDAAPLAGELLSRLSEQVQVFRARHGHAAGLFTIDQREVLAVDAA